MSWERNLGVHLFDVFMDLRTIYEVHVGGLVILRVVCQRRIRETVCLRDEIDHVQTEPIIASAHPESHNVPDSGTHNRVIPVQVWLLRHEQVEIVFPGCRVAFIGRALEHAR